MYNFKNCRNCERCSLHGAENSLQLYLRWNFIQLAFKHHWWMIFGKREGKKKSTNTTAAASCVFKSERKWECERRDHIPIKRFKSWIIRVVREKERCHVKPLCYLTNLIEARKGGYRRRKFSQEICNAARPTPYDPKPICLSIHSVAVFLS